MIRLRDSQVSAPSTIRTSLCQSSRREIGSFTNGPDRGVEAENCSNKVFGDALGARSHRRSIACSASDGVEVRMAAILLVDQSMRIGASLVSCRRHNVEMGRRRPF